MICINPVEVLFVIIGGLYPAMTINSIQTWKPEHHI